MDAKQVAADLAKLGANAYPVAQRVVQTEGLRLLAGVKKNAGRPRTAPSLAGVGPRIQTGDYNRSIGLRVTGVSKTVRGSVGTNAVQGKRLEFGFEGPGQRTLPHPHFGPALDAEEPRFLTALGAAIAEATR